MAARSIHANIGGTYLYDQPLVRIGLRALPLVPDEAEGGRDSARRHRLLVV